MKKDIVLPGGRFVLRYRWWTRGGARICHLDDSSAPRLLVQGRDLLPMARALIEIHEVFQADKKKHNRKLRAREAAEKKK